VGAEGQKNHVDSTYTLVETRIKWAFPPDIGYLNAF
jgi:hypothetical protein